jgi:hypothetical protein
MGGGEFSRRCKHRVSQLRQESVTNPGPATTCGFKNPVEIAICRAKVMARTPDKPAKAERTVASGACRTLLLNPNTNRMYSLRVSTVFSTCPVPPRATKEPEAGRILIHD